VYVTGTRRSIPILSNFSSGDSDSSTPPSSFGSDTSDDLASSNESLPLYSMIYPPSPPSSAPSSPDSAIRIKPTYNFPAGLSIAPPTAIKPLLTPRHSTDSATGLFTVPTKPTVLATVFPDNSPVQGLPCETISLTSLSPSWTGAVLENPAMGTRTLFVVGGSYEDVNLRDSVCGVLEMAENDLGCNGVVMCLEKNTPDLDQLLHSLMYVGGTITKGVYDPNPAYILVGLDV